MSAVTRRVVVRGRVQGVGFRAFVEAEAQARALAGFVRNRRDGTVEAVFAGPAAIVEAMIAACRQGPPAAWVDTVDVYDADGEEFGLGGRAARFTVLTTE